MFTEHLLCVTQHAYSACSRKTKQTREWQAFLAHSLVPSLLVGPERNWKTWSLPSLRLYFRLASTYSMPWELEKPDRRPAAFRKFMEVYGLLGASQTHLAALPGHRLPPGASGCVGLRWGSLRICSHTGFPDDALAISVCLGIHTEKP